jgi:hypothetical protein
MNSTRFAQKLAKGIVLGLVLAIGFEMAQCESGAREPAIRLETMDIHPYEPNRLDAVGKVVGFVDWPRTDIYRVVPRLDKSVLGISKAISSEKVFYNLSSVGQSKWPEMMWKCSKAVRREEPVPTELPPKEMERIEKRLATLPPRMRNDPNYVEKLIQRRLDKYRKSRMYRVEGYLDVEIYAAPSCRAAQEFMLVDMISNSMTTELTVSTYARGKQPKGLGTVSFVTESAKRDDVRVRFVRDNIYVKIFGDRIFAQEALPVARKIDGLLKAKGFTKTQLSARRPVVKMESAAEKRKRKKERWIAFDATVPAGTKIVHKRAFVDGEEVDVIGKAIRIVGRTSGKAKVTLTVMTDELGTETIEQEVTIEE